MAVKSPDNGSNLAKKRILLGISGGIAAYKAPALVRLLRKADAEVQVVTTRSAEQFVTHAALQAVSGNPVRSDLWDSNAEAAMGHIELARWADAVLIAPATADVLARLAQGRADDLLTTLCLATRAPLLVAPAMNNVMWSHPATQHNVEILRSRGVVVLGPDDGEQACGEFGPGRMREPEDLVADLQSSRNFSSPTSAQADGLSGGERPLQGKRVVVTAGPTREALDPVRYVSNHSSGKQGFAVAAAARDAGADVVLIAGPVDLPTPIGVTRMDVTSALEMHQCAMGQATDCDLFVGVAAVADYRPASPQTQKIKKTRSQSSGWALELLENPDIIASVAAQPDPPVTVGFAAETQHTLENARSKCKRKRLDAIVVNDVSDTSIGFNSDLNAATLVWANGELALAKQSKADLAAELIHQITVLFVQQLADTHPESVSKQR